MSLTVDNSFFLCPYTCTIFIKLREHNSKLWCYSRVFGFYFLLYFVFIALPKIPGATECELHRTISLMSHITKVLLRVLMLRMCKSLRPEIAKTQFGFVPDKGTRNAIFTLSMLMERCIEVQKDLSICFIDYSKAFDKVKHEKLVEMLNQLDIDGKDLRVLRNLYWDQTAAVRVDGKLSWVHKY